MKIGNTFTTGFLSLTILVVSIIPLFSCSSDQKEPKNYLIGVVNPNAGTQDINRGFVEGLAELGYVEGKNTSFIRAASSFELDQVVQDMVARDVDLIFSVTTPATRKAQEATRIKNIPVIYAMQDPVASGLIKSLAQPNSNLTGVQIRGSVPKAVEWMRQVSPAINHFFVPVKYDTVAAKQSLEDLTASVEYLGLKLTLAEVNDQVELEKAVAAIPEDADAIFILCSIFIHSNVEKLVQAAIEKKILIGSGTAQSDRGVTVSYGMIAEKTGRQASRMAHLILSGRAPADVPSEISDFFIGVNLKTAGMSGIDIPMEVIQQADFVIR